MPSRSIRDGRQGGISKHAAPTPVRIPVRNPTAPRPPQSLGGQAPNRGSVAAGNSLINQTGVGARPTPIANAPGPVGPMPVAAPVQQGGAMPINAPTGAPMVNTQPVIGSRPVTR